MLNCRFFVLELKHFSNYAKDMRIIQFIYELASLYSECMLGTLLPCLIMLRECEVDLEPFVPLPGQYVICFIIILCCM